MVDLATRRFSPPGTFIPTPCGTFKRQHRLAAGIDYAVFAQVVLVLEGADAPVQCRGDQRRWFQRAVVIKQSQLTQRPAHRLQVIG